MSGSPQPGPPAPSISPGDSSALWSALERDGYAVVELALPSVLGALRSSYQRAATEVTGFQASMYLASAEERRRIFQEISGHLQPSIDTVLPGWRIVVANYLAKSPQPDGTEVALHFDWAFVDETTDLTLNVWTPLMPVDEQNGCLEVVVGSHRECPFPRSHGDPCPRRGWVARHCPERLRSVPLVPGQAVVYDGRLLHGSGINRSGRERLAVGCVLARPQSSLLYYHRVDPTAVEVFAVDPTFYWDYIPGERPRGRSARGVFAAPLPEEQN